MNTRIILAALIILGLNSCDPAEYTQEAADIPVVSAFLVPGQTPEIVLTRIIPYAASEADTIAIPLTGLDVFLNIAGSDRLLVEDTAGSGRYILPDGGNLIQPGDSVGFHTVYNGNPVTAVTVIPAAPAGLSLSSDVLYYSSGNPSSWLSAGAIDLTWENPQEDFYYLTVQNMEVNPTPLNEMAENMPKMGSASPSRGDAFRIGMRNITYFGTHQVIIYHVNQEFAELFDNPGMSTVALTETPTNVSNGLGIFTAMYPDTVYFEVKGY